MQGVTRLIGLRCASRLLQGKAPGLTDHKPASRTQQPYSRYAIAQNELKRVLKTRKKLGSAVVVAAPELSEGRLP